MKHFFLYIKKLLFIITFLFFQKSLVCYSQNLTSPQRIDFKFSEPLKMQRCVNQYDIVGETSEGIVIHKWGKKKHIIEIYDPQNLQLLHTKSLLFKSEKGVKVHNIYLYPNNEAIIVYTVASSKHVFIFTKKINLLTENQFISNDQPIGAFSPKEKQGSLFLKSEISANKQFIGILCYYISLHNDNTRSAYYTVINNNNQPTPPTFAPLRFEENHQLTAYFVSNEGNSIITSTYYKNNFLDAYTHFGNTTTYITDFENKCYVDSITTLVPEKHRACHLQFEIDNNNQQLVLLSTITESSNNSSKLEKMQYCVIDMKNKNIKKNEIIPLQYNSNNKADQSSLLFFFKKQDLEDIQLHKLILRRDGGFIAALENNYTTVLQPPSSTRTSSMITLNSSTTRYYYNDVLLLNVSPEGNVETSNLLKKIQVSEEDRGYFSSFGLFNLKNELYFVFNETIEYGSPLNAYILQGNGDYLVKQFFNDPTHSLKFAPQYLKQITNKSVIIPAFDKKNQFIITKFSVQ